MSLIRYTIFMVFLFMMACGNGPQKPEPVLDQTTQPTVPSNTTAPPVANNATTPPASQSPAQNKFGIWHYTCPKGCSGGGGSAAPCGSCGETLVHNQAYHANTNPNAPTAKNNLPKGNQAAAAAPSQANAIPLGNGMSIKPLPRNIPNR